MAKTPKVKDFDIIIEMENEKWESIVNKLRKLTEETKNETTIRDINSVIDTINGDLFGNNHGHVAYLLSNPNQREIIEERITNMITEIIPHFFEEQTSKERK